MAKKVLVVSDNERILQLVVTLLEESPALSKSRSFDFACAPWDKALSRKKIGSFTVQPLDIKKAYQKVIKDYDFVFSAHCKQLFPEQLTKELVCINIHPGLNPHNRGWYPQVFSIINGLPLGATLHEIDSYIDHGAIIDQEEVEVLSEDTSLDAYNRVMDAEQSILRRSFGKVLDGTYTAKKPSSEGNLNLLKDFNTLCKLDLDETATYGEVINRLRALTHGSFKNAYFIDKSTNKKIYISVQLEVDDEK